MMARKHAHTTCTEWGYEYQYVAPAFPPPPNAPNLQTVPHTFLPNASRTDLAAPGQAGLPRRREAKSGAAFIRRLGLKLNSTKESKLSSFGWNVGVRQISTEPPTVVVHANEITSPEEFKKLAWVYFDKVDPCYGFIDKRAFFEQLNSRWSRWLPVHRSPIAYWLVWLLWGVSSLSGTQPLPTSASIARLTIPYNPVMNQTPQDYISGRSGISHNILPAE